LGGGGSRGGKSIFWAPGQSEKKRVNVSNQKKSTTPGPRPNGGRKEGRRRQEVAEDPKLQKHKKKAQRDSAELAEGNGSFKKHKAVKKERKDEGKNNGKKGGLTLR